MTHTLRADADKDFLRTEPLGKLLFRLALPTVVAQIINMLYNIVDRIYIGHIPETGDLALTGLGVCLPLIMIVSAFAALVSNGGAPRASIFMGAGDNVSAEKTLGNCFVTQIFVSVLLTATLLIWNREFLRAFGASDNTIGYAADYMNIYAVGTIFVQLTLGMNAFITAQGFATTGMLSVLMGAVLNIALDPVFIFAFDMGVKGAALATVISQAASCAWVLSFLFGKKTNLRICLKYMRISPGIIFPALALGLSTFVMQASESVILVGAMTVASSVMQFALLPLQGLGQGAQPIVSYNFGAKDAARVKAAFRRLLVVSAGYASVLYVFAMALPGAFAAMFTSGEQLIDYTARVLRIYMAAMFLMGVQMACQMTFVAIGNAKASILVAVVRKFVLLLPLIYIMPAIFVEDRAAAVFAAEPVADAIAVTFTAILFFFRFRKSMRSIGSDHPSDIGVEDAAR